LLQLIAAAIPARYYIDGLRGVLLKGNGLAELWPEALCLLGFAVLMLSAVCKVRAPARLTPPRLPRSALNVSR
jgi:ABC-2 type transport system permease protein